MQVRIKNLRKLIDGSKAVKASLVKQIANSEQSLTHLKEEIEDLQQSRAILMTEGEQMQKEFSDYLQSLVTLGLRAVIDRPYEFKIAFKNERGKPVCPVKILENKHELIPKEDVGHGALDIGGLVFQISMIPLIDNVLPFLWSDEPTRNIGTGEEARKIGIVVKEISRKLGMQLIINTHDEALMEAGDRVWEFKHNGEYTESELVIDRWEE